MLPFLHFQRDLTDRNLDWYMLQLFAAEKLDRLVMLVATMWTLHLQGMSRGSNLVA